MNVCAGLIIAKKADKMAKKGARIVLGCSGIEKQGLLMCMQRVAGDVLKALSRP